VRKFDVNTKFRYPFKLNEDGNLRMWGTASYPPRLSDSSVETLCIRLTVYVLTGPVSPKGFRTYREKAMSHDIARADASAAHQQEILLFMLNTAATRLGMDYEMYKPLSVRKAKGATNGV
jgi:hypothetical protein